MPDHFLGKVATKAIIVKNGKVLIARDHRDSDTWDLPGGRMDIDESIEMAITRELREELGIAVHFKSFICSEQVMHVRDNLPQLFVTCEVTMDNESAIIQVSGEELAEIKWIDKNMMKDIKIYINSQHALEIYWK